MDNSSSIRNYGIARAIECALLYIGLPAVLAFVPAWVERKWGVQLRAWVIPTLIIASGIAYAAMRSAGLMHSGDVLHLRKTTRLDWMSMLSRFAIGAALLTAILAAVNRGALLSFPRSAPKFWLFVCIAYPILSVVPQGILYRALWEKRYARGLSERLSLIIGAALFAWAHIVFHNFWACAFTFVGGLFFLSSYRKTGSLLFSAIEHALYGDFIFTIGWGAFFYEGTQAAMAAAAQ